MNDYEKIKKELLQISSVLEKFPDNVKPQVFELLVSTFKETEHFSKNDAQNFTNKNSTNNLNSTSSGKPDLDKKTKAVSKKSVGPKKSPSESYSIDRNLDLRGGKNIPSFKNFFEEKKPLSTAEINAVSVYYLKNLIKLSNVTLNHVYTCYKEVGKKPADYFKQSFRDTKNKQGYIEFDENWNLTIPHRGVSFVEHDLPNKKKKAS